MVKCLNILVFVFISSLTFGQVDSLMKVSKSNLRLGIGLIHVRMIDEGYTDSRLLFRGTNFKFALAYGRETDNHIFNFVLAGSVGKIESARGDLPSDYYFAQPSLEYLRKTSVYNLFRKENRLFLGGLASSYNQGIENERVINNLSIYSLHGFYFGICNRLILNNKNYFQVSYSMPVVVYENRLLYNGGASKYTYRDTENIPALLTDSGKFTYFNILGNIQFGLDYVMQIGRSTNLVMGYKFFCASSLIEAPLNLYSNELIIELKIGL